MDKVIFLSF